MTRMQFFRLMEGGGARKSKAFRKQKAKGMLAPLVKREDVPVNSGNKKAFQIMADASKEGKIDVAKRVARTTVNSGMQDVGKAVKGRGRHIAAAGGAGLLGLAGMLKARANRRAAADAARPINRIKGAGKAALAAVRANPKKAAAAALATGAGMMFLRKKRKEDKKK